MKAPNPSKRTRRPTNALGRHDLRVEVSQEEIMADLLYPAPARRVKRRP